MIIETEEKSMKDIDALLLQAIENCGVSIYHSDGTIKTAYEVLKEISEHFKINP